MGIFKKGDIVRHTILETEKVIVGLGKDRYLCVHPGDIKPDGHVRPHSRVAMHRADNLERIGYHEGVIEVDLDSLYREETVSRHTVATRWRREDILISILFVLGVALIVLALFSGIDLARREIERAFFKRVDEVKTGYHRKIQKELREKADAKKALREILQKR